MAAATALGALLLAAAAASLTATGGTESPPPKQFSSEYIDDLRVAFYPPSPAYVLVGDRLDVAIELSTDLVAYMAHRPYSDFYAAIWKPKMAAAAATATSLERAAGADYRLTPVVDDSYKYDLLLALASPPQQQSAHRLLRRKQQAAAAAVTSVTTTATVMTSTSARATAAVAVEAFALSAEQLGRDSVHVLVYETLRAQPNDSLPIASARFDVIATRQRRPVDAGFDGVLSLLVALNAFALGCLTTIEGSRSTAAAADAAAAAAARRVRHHVAAAAMTAYIVMPLAAYGLCKAGGLSSSLTYGVLFVALLPGGGLGHLVNVVADGEVPLSLAVNLMHVVVPIGTMPLWLLAFRPLIAAAPDFSDVDGPPPAADPDLLLALACAAGPALPYSVGVALRHFRRPAADALLNWLVKPLLLLVFVLFVTLGLYINLYALDALDGAAVAVASALPLCAALIGAVLSLAASAAATAISSAEAEASDRGEALGGDRGGLPTRRRAAAAAAKRGAFAVSARTVAAETAVCNGALAVASLRLTLPQPDGDVASAAALYALLFAPAPFVALLAFCRARHAIIDYFEQEKLEREQRQAVAATFASITGQALRLATGVGLATTSAAARCAPGESEGGQSGGSGCGRRRGCRACDTSAAAPLLSVEASPDDSSPAAPAPQPNGCDGCGSSGERPFGCQMASNYPLPVSVPAVETTPTTVATLAPAPSAATAMPPRRTVTVEGAELCRAGGNVGCVTVGRSADTAGPVISRQFAKNKRKKPRPPRDSWRAFV